VYPALWNRTFPSEGRTPDQQDAFAIAKWMQAADGDGNLEKYFRPRLEPDERKKAEIEGLDSWTFVAPLSAEQRLKKLFQLSQFDAEFMVAARNTLALNVHSSVLVRHAVGGKP
ncbi:MAG: hypothetical protein WA581_05995, partial [Candidatus Acidiferrales bacterium]